MDLLITCPKGVEYLLADEITTLGLTLVRHGNTFIRASGNLEATCRTILWSRLANRVMVVVAEGGAENAQDLTRLASEVDWQAHMAPTGSVWIQFQGASSSIRNTRFGAQCIKDGVVDRMQAVTGERPRIDRESPDLILQARLNRGRLVLGIDLCGESLHRRGYRTEAGEAPLKENLAAAILLRSDWPRIQEAEGHLIDPLCGSGTFLVEAAMMATDMAPGLLREPLAQERWKGFDGTLWTRLMTEARQRHEEGRVASHHRFYGFDEDRRVIASAWRNVERAGLADRVHVERRSLDEFQLPPASRTGLIVTNPPYGERLSSKDKLGELYQCLGRVVREQAQGWRLGVFTAEPDYCHSLGLRSDRQYHLFNGRIATDLLLFDVTPDNERRVRLPDDPDGPPRPRISHRERADMFANRLRKNQRKLAPWARKQGIECFRLYDADMPEFALAIDCYGDWLHVQEYAPPAKVPAEAARERLAEALAMIPDALGVAPDKLVVKQRQRQKGHQQYEKQAEEGHFFTVIEGGCQFRVNLRDYLDTGLFLDHRPVRLWLQQAAKGKRFLNLFCYTGAATVHAACGGASRSLSLDMSNTYLDWAGQNWALNGMDRRDHRLERADCLAWLAGKADEQFDLIFLDPPTFSNSARMEEVLDVQRDHRFMIEQAMARLAPEGTLVFSNNFRRFRLDESLVERFQVEDRTAWSLDRDFQRNARIHQCWFIRHR